MTLRMHPPVVITDWIRREADKIKAQDRDDADERRRDGQQADIVSAGWLQAWRPVHDAVAAQIDTFNAEFVHSPERYITRDGSTDSQVQLRRGDARRVTVLQVTPSPAGITVRTVITGYRPGEPNHSSTDAVAAFCATPANTVGLLMYGDLTTADQVAEAILRRLF